MAARGFAIRRKTIAIGSIKDYGDIFACALNGCRHGVQFRSVYPGATLRNFVKKARMNMGECLFLLRNGLLRVNHHLRKRQVNTEKWRCVAI